MKKTEKDKIAWMQWLQGYGEGRFYDAFVEIAQGAESTCVQCGENIYLDIVEGGGVPDWKTENGDYGCADSPDSGEEGTGSHKPEKLQ